MLSHAEYVGGSQSDPVVSLYLLATCHRSTTTCKSRQDTAVDSSFRCVLLGCLVCLGRIHRLGVGQSLKSYISVCAFVRLSFQTRSQDQQ
jgi:hypothetical protein